MNDHWLIFSHSALTRIADLLFFQLSSRSTFIVYVHIYIIEFNCFSLIITSDYFLHTNVCIYKKYVHVCLYINSAKGVNWISIDIRLIRFHLIVGPYKKGKMKGFPPPLNRSKPYPYYSDRPSGNLVHARVCVQMTIEKNKGRSASACYTPVK